MMLQFGHGGEAVEITQKVRKGGLRGCFNSATAVKPWRFHRREGQRRKKESFNSATAVKPWRSHGHHLREKERIRFNSATAVKPWRCRITAAGCGIDHECFNSATAVKPWRYSLGTRERLLFWLQFGHGGEAVEMLDDALICDVVIKASIRPRR